MKFNNIKTIGQFEQYAECAYQRTHNLREKYESMPDKDNGKQKAFRLYLEMVSRMMIITTMYNRIKSYQYSNFSGESAGIR